MMKKRSVGIIGAGAAGLCAIRHFKDHSKLFDPIVCYEQTNLIGGTWNYVEDVGIDPQTNLPVHSSIYRDMRVNGPVQIMDFPDYPFQSVKSYTHHSDVLQYLHDYSSRFNLYSFIRFGQHLKYVSREMDSWLIEVQDLKTGSIYKKLYDILIVCPGRYSKPFWPSISTISQFGGSLIHSHDYRTSEPYFGKRVAVIGAGPSGIDITLELSSLALEVFFINNTTNQFANLPKNVQQLKGELYQFGHDSICIRYKETEIHLNMLDAIILATGYRLWLDYIDESSCGIELNQDNTINGIYRHFINISHPTMALLSICMPTLSFPLYHQQILYYIKLLNGEIYHPTKEEMISESEKDHEIRKTVLLYRDKDRHLLKNLQLLKNYFELIENDGQLKPIKPVVFSLLEYIVKTRNENPIGYKEFNYRLVDDSSFQIIYDLIEDKIGG